MDIYSLVHSEISFQAQSSLLGTVLIFCNSEARPSMLEAYFSFIFYLEGKDSAQLQSPTGHLLNGVQNYSLKHHFILYFSTNETPVSGWIKLVVGLSNSSFVFLFLYNNRFCASMGFK